MKPIPQKPEWFIRALPYVFLVASGAASLTGAPQTGATAVIIAVVCMVLVRIRQLELAIAHTIVALAARR